MVGTSWGGIKWETWGMGPALQKPLPGRGRENLVGGMPALCPCLQGPSSLWQNLAFLIFFPQCRLTPFLTRTHFWSLSTPRVAGSKGRGTKPCPGSSEFGNLCVMEGTCPEEDIKRVGYRISIPCHELSFVPT